MKRRRAPRTRAARRSCAACDDREVRVDVAHGVDDAGLGGERQDRLGVGPRRRHRLLDEEVDAARQALADDGQVRVRRRADEDGLGPRRGEERVEARVERGPEPLAREVRGEPRVAVDEAHDLGLGMHLEKVAVDHAHAARADDGGAERWSGAHAASASVRASPSASGVRRGR